MTSLSLAALCLALPAAIAAATTTPVPLNLSDFVNKRVLFVTAHPDDIEGFSGGLAAKLISIANISYLINTNGNKGGKCYNATAPNFGPLVFRSCEKEELAYVRRKEMVSAAKYLGVSEKDVHRFSVGDGMMLAQDETLMRLRLSIILRVVRPHIIISHNPEPVWLASPTCNGKCPDERAQWGDLGYHPDHKHVGHLLYTAVYGGGSVVDNEHAFTELMAAGLAPHKPDQMYFFSLTNANPAQPMTHYLALDEDTLGKKINASFLHRSQYLDRETLALNTKWVTQQVAKNAVPGEGIDRSSNTGSTAAPLYAEGYQAWF